MSEHDESILSDRDELLAFFTPHPWVTIREVSALSENITLRTNLAVG
jgi:hypothetical protein